MPDIELWHWLVFAALVGVLLALDLLVFHRHARVPSLKESAGWSVFWIGLALVFNAVIWWYEPASGTDFLMAYLVEKSLSMDNLFVFAVIFGYFQIPVQYQYRVLFWGVLGAIVLRVVFILGGVTLVQRFDWVVCLFGVFLVYTGFKLLKSHGATVEPEHNVAIRFARRFFRVSTEIEGEHFFVRKDGLVYATPLFLVLLLIESTDVLFAVDSVPAVIGITKDPFVAITSNIFAILGLRALYFLLAGVIDRFQYLHYGLSAVLIFIGVKMIAEYIGKKEYFGEGYHLDIPRWVSLTIIASLLTLSMVGSVLITKHRKTSESRELEAEDGEPPTDG